MRDPGALRSPAAAPARHAVTWPNPTAASQLRFSRVSSLSLFFESLFFFFFFLLFFYFGTYGAAIGEIIYDEATGRLLARIGQTLPALPCAAWEKETRAAAASTGVMCGRRGALFLSLRAGMR